MSKLPQPSLATLERKLSAIEKQVQEWNPELFEEWQYLRRRIEMRKTDVTDDFAGIKTPLEAFYFCLQERGGWMTKKDIVERLKQGGFISNRAQEWKMNTLLNYHSDPDQGDNLQRHGDQEGWDMLIGRKGWKKPK